MYLLETNDIDFSRARSWLHKEAEILVITLTLSDHVGSHRHALDVLDCPVLFFFFNLAVVFIIVIVVIVILLIILLFHRFLFAEESLRNLQFYIDQTIKVIGSFAESKRSFRDMDMCPLIFLQIFNL